MVGALNKLPMAILGAIFFGSPMNVGGVISIAIGKILFHELLLFIYLLSSIEKNNFQKVSQEVFCIVIQSKRRSKNNLNNNNHKLITRSRRFQKKKRILDR